MSRSSTSSSEPRVDLRGFDVRAGLVCVVLLVLFEVLVARRPDIWTNEPRSSGAVLDTIQREVLDGADPPEILVFGSSRVRDAIAPEILEEELGLGRRAVLNLSATGGTPSDAERLVRSNAELFGSARCYLIGVEDWYLNGTIPPTARDRRYARLEERLDFGEHSLAMVVGWAWHTNGANDVLRRYIRLRGSPGTPLVVLDDGRISWRQGREDNNHATPEADALRFFTRYERVEHRMDRIGRVIEFARAHGAQVFLLHVPLHSEYRAWMRRERPEVLADLAQSVGRLCEVGPSEVQPLWWSTPPTDLSLGDAGFRDYGHVTDAAAQDISRAVARRLRERCSGP